MGIIRERKNSGLSVKSFCEKAGIQKSLYYYWQRKLREGACEELVKYQSRAVGLAPTGFAEVRLTAQPSSPPMDAAIQSHVCIEAAGVRIMADSAYPVDKLAALMGEVARPC